MKGFNPICRYSNRALALLDSYMKEGHSAHSEVMVTTCLHNHGMKIGDIGGMGEFTPDGYRNRYYIIRCRDKQRDYALATTLHDREG